MFYLLYYINNIKTVFANFRVFTFSFFTNQACKLKMVPTPEMVLTTHETQVAVYLFDESQDPE